MIEVPYEEQTRTLGFLVVIGKLAKVIYVHRFAMGRIRKDVDAGVPFPRRLDTNRQTAARAQREAEEIMIAHVGYITNEGK